MVWPTEFCFSFEEPEEYALSVLNTPEPSPAPCPLKDGRLVPCHRTGGPGEGARAALKTSGFLPMQNGKRTKHQTRFPNSVALFTVPFLVGRGPTY